MQRAATTAATTITDSTSQFYIRSYFSYHLLLLLSNRRYTCRGAIPTRFSIPTPLWPYFRALPLKSEPLFMHHTFACFLWFLEQPGSISVTAAPAYIVRVTRIGCRNQLQQCDISAGLFTAPSRKPLKASVIVCSTYVTYRCTTLQALQACRSASSVMCYNASHPDHRSSLQTLVHACVYRPTLAFLCNPAPHCKLGCSIEIASSVAGCIETPVHHSARAAHNLRVYAARLQAHTLQTPCSTIIRSQLQVAPARMPASNRMNRVAICIG